MTLENDKITMQFNSDVYQLLEKIGEGGFGHVYLAKQINTGQSVAIKFLAINSEFDATKRARYIERFERETLLGSRLQHPNIVRLLDKGESGDLLYAVFEYVEGQTLKQRLTQLGALSAIEATDVMTQVLDALAHAHQQGVVHRDIKPANIMLTESAAKLHIKVLDFGIGTLVNEARVQDYKSITLTHETLGTPSYSSPEQLRGEPATVKTDLYVWGLVFIECLTGKPAMSGSNLASIFHKQLSQENVALPSAIVGHPLAALLRRVLQKKAHLRSVNAPDLYHEIQQINVANLVGELHTENDRKIDNIYVAIDNDATLIHDNPIFNTGHTERKQLTVMAVRLNANVVKGKEVDFEVIDTLHRDQKNQCLDTAIRYGAFHVGTLGDVQLFYYGYPAASDNDVRLCARTALDLISDLNKRNALLKTNQGIHLDIKIGIHTGLLTCYADVTPEGDTANIALQLVRLASNEQILCSDSSQKILQSYIEFKPLKHQPLGVTSTPTALFNLMAERQVEAFGFLRAAQNNHLFIGREQEINSLLALQKSQRRYQLAHVFGEAGIGKSRLIFEFRNKSNQYTHFMGQCLPEHINNALYPILNILNYKYALSSLSTADAINKLETEIRAFSAFSLEDILPILCAWLGYPLAETMAPSALSPDLQKQLLFKTLIALLNKQDNGQANLIVFEDMHWADPTSLEFINSFAQSDDFTRSNNLFISTSRQPLPTLFDSENYQSIVLYKLTDQDSKAFVVNLFDKQSVATQLLNTVVSRTDGIPLFIEELVDMLKQKGLVQHINGITDFIDSEKIDQLPTSLRDSLQQKLDSLVYSKETAQLAATIGREFDYKLLVASSSRSEAQLQTDLDELISTDLILQKRRVAGDSYIFKHALVRDAAYESMPVDSVKKLHDKIASALVVSEMGDAWLIAYHYSEAELYIEAIGYVIKAIKSSVTLSNYIEAKTYFDIATKWVELAVKNRELAMLELSLYKNIFPACIAQDGMGSDIVAKTGNKIGELEIKLNIESEIVSDAMFLCQWAELQNYHYRSQTSDAIASGEASLKLAEKDGVRQRQLLLLAQMVQVYTCAGNHTKSIETGNRALSLYREEDADMYHEFGWDPKCVTLSQLSHAYALQGNISKAYSLGDESYQHAKQLGSEVNIEIALLFEVFIGYLTENKNFILRKSEMLDDQRDWSQDSWYLLFIQLGRDWALNNTRISKGFANILIADGRGGPFFYWLSMWLDTEIAKDNLEEPMTLLNTFIKISKENGVIGPIPLLLKTLSMAEFKLGNIETAYKMLDEALIQSNQQGAILMSLDIAVQYASLLRLEGHEIKANVLVAQYSKNLERDQLIQIKQYQKFLNK